MKAKISFSKENLTAKQAKALSAACERCVSEFDDRRSLHVTLEMEDPELPELVTTLQSFELRFDLTGKRMDGFWALADVTFTAAELRKAPLFRVSPRYDISLLFDEGQRKKGVYEVTLESWDEGDVSRAAVRQFLDGTLHAFEVDRETTAVSDAFRAAIEGAKLAVKFRPVRIRFAKDVPVRTKEARFWALEPVAVLPGDYLSLAELVRGELFGRLPLLDECTRYAALCVDKTNVNAPGFDYAKLHLDGEEDDPDLEIVSARFRDVAKEFRAPLAWDIPVFIRQ